MNQKQVLINTDYTSKIKIPIKPLTLKDLKNLERWATINNLHVHPAYLAAIKKQRKLLVEATVAGTVLGMIIIVLIVKTIVYLTR